MRRLLLLLVVGGCHPAVGARVDDPASVVFEAPPGNMQGWSFAGHGLPAVDTRTGEILAVDAERAAVLSLRPDEPVKLEAMLLDHAALADLHVVEDETEEERHRDRIAATVRENIRTANASLARRTLRPLEACRLPADAPMIFCRRPQTILCGARAISVASLPQIAPMQIGDGPPKSMIACIEEAHLDTATNQLAVRYHQVCEGGGSDACTRQGEWRVTAAPTTRPR